MVLFYILQFALFASFARMEYQEALKIANERKREKMEERLAK